MRTSFFAILGLFALLSAAPQPALSQCITADPSLARARAARDSDDISALQTAIQDAQAKISASASYENYLRLALLEDWMCEAAHGHDDSKLLKKASQAGVDAAEKAAALKPDSSDAHWLTGDLLGELIPNVFGGGFRYGARSSRELDQAIQLDPRNANAFVSRATSYFFTPAMFGGSKEKAAEMLQKAIALDPSSDAADTAHIWLAQVYQSQGKHDDAVRESAEALRLNPQRRYAQYISQQIASGKKP